MEPPLADSARKAESEQLSLAAGIRVNKAQNLFDKGKIKEAIDILEEYISKSESNSLSIADRFYLPFLLGNYYSVLFQDADERNQQILDKTVQYYRAALKAKPDFGSAWLNLARCRYEAGNFKAAAPAFEKGYHYSNPQKAGHLYCAVISHFQSQNSKKALSLFNRLSEDHPDKVTLSWKEVLVNILFSLDRYKEALPYIEELARKSPSSDKKQKKWQEILLHQYLNLDMDAKALAYAGELTEKDPLEPKWWKTLSHIHLKDNNLKKGLSSLIIYGFLAPMTHDELELTADLYLSLGVPEKAASLYRKQLRCVHDPVMFEKIVHAFTMAHDSENAINWIDRGLASLPETGEFQKTRTGLIKLKKQLKQLEEFYARGFPADNPN